MTHNGILDALAQIRQTCGHDNYLSARDAAEKEYEQAYSELNNYESATSMYENFISKFTRNRCCPLCSRSYPSASEEEQFLQKLTKSLNRIPEAIKDSKDELDVAEKARNALRDLQKVWDRAQRLKDEEIPKLKKSCEDLMQEKAFLVSEHEDVSRVAFGFARSISLT